MENRLSSIENENKLYNRKLETIIDRINELEKDINNNDNITKQKNNTYLTVNEITKIYKISKEKIYKELKDENSDLIYSQKKEGGKIIIRQKDFDIWFNSFIVPDILSETHIEEDKEKKQIPHKEYEEFELGLFI